MNRDCQEDDKREERGCPVEAGSCVVVEETTNNALNSALQKNDLEKLKSLFSDERTKIEAFTLLHQTNNLGSSPLHLAAINDLDEATEFLIAMGAKVDARDKDQFTPLHFAANEDATKAMRVLITRGADVNALTEDFCVQFGGFIPIYMTGGKTPLMLAAGHGNEVAVRMLLDSHADKDLVDYDGNNAAMHAVLNRYIEVAKLLDPSLESPPSNEWIKAKTKSDLEARTKRINEKERAKKESLDKEHSSYSHAYPELLALKDSFFHPSFLRLIRGEAKLRLVPFDRSTLSTSPTTFTTEESGVMTDDEGVTAVREVIPHVYELDVFTEEFCKKLIAEVGYIENSGLKLTRPNSMNNYGLVFDQFGFKEMMHKLVMEFVQPLANILFSSPDEVRSTPTLSTGQDDSIIDEKNLIRFKAHHAFMVKYKKGQDETLDEHADSSLVTLNVCLGKTFTGGHVYFRPLEEQEEEAQEEQEEDKIPRSSAQQKTRTEVTKERRGGEREQSAANTMEYRPVKGKAILHLGRHRHGVNRLQSGERCNLIVWAR